MESKQLTYNTKVSLLKKIKDFYKKVGASKVNSERFELPENICYFKFRVVCAMEQVLLVDLECDLTLEDDFLERVKLYLNGV